MDTNPNRIKAIVFDFGGVIQFLGPRNILGNIAQIIGVSREDFVKQYFEYNHLSNVENMPWHEMVLKVVSVFTESPNLKTLVVEEMRQNAAEKRLNHELLDFLPVLRKQGYIVALFSNNTTELRGEMKTLGIDSLFDEIVVSGEIGFQKPHQEAFSVLFQKLQLLPHEIVFIDDTLKSLEKAQEIGYVPIHFKDNVQLQTDLASLGILL